ncbi:hypothetical protein NL676_020215 [Syzygium grande]|nr:hypothetical protein NL676_020215 [Syzygium grande]
MQRGKRGRLYHAWEITQPVGFIARNAETKRRFAVCFSICSKNFFSPLSCNTLDRNYELEQEEEEGELLRSGMGLDRFRVWVGLNMKSQI